MRYLLRQTTRHLGYSGVFLGGVGAGGFEIRPDGTYHNCRIFNEWDNANPYKLEFIFEHDNHFHMLSLDPLNNPLLSVDGVAKMGFESRLGTVKLDFPGLPVTLEFSSSLVPGDEKASTLPAVRCRARGQGTLYVLVPSHLPVCGFVEKDRIALRGKQGALLVHAPKAEKLIRHEFHWKYRHLLKQHGDPVPYDKVSGKYTAALILKGRFDECITLAWHVPDWKDLRGHSMRPSYVKYFKSADQVLAHVRAKGDDLLGKTAAFEKAVRRLPYPEHVHEGILGQFSTLVKQSWLTAGGDFGVWEGSCCCCGLQTTDVAYYGSWLYADLYPEWERAGMRVLAKFQSKEGWIPHMMNGSFKQVADYERRDLNMQFILQYYRDYMLWKDEAFLRELYPAARRALAFAFTWDEDGDGIPDLLGKDSTFDQWSVKGCCVYIATIWIAALAAMEKVAGIMGDPRLAARCAKVREQSRESMIRKLWNGKYFILADHKDKKDTGCLLDALSGDWFARLCGLEPVVPDDMVRSHLRSCLRLNRKKIDRSTMRDYAVNSEEGWCYINGGYPDGRKVCNQQDEPWTGLEYTFAAQLILMGMKKEGLRVLKDLHDRKARAGLFFNHMECGGDYYRAMAIGLLMTPQLQAAMGSRGDAFKAWRRGPRRL